MKYVNSLLTVIMLSSFYVINNVCHFVEEKPTDELIHFIEDELGFKLPASYIELMKIHNGGEKLTSVIFTLVRKTRVIFAYFYTRKVNESKIYT